jgi:AraC family L-rhamnose operon transcriptional activator RhaR
LLRTQDCLIGEVAARCGFDDSNYFSVVFTRETGLTPSAWRQRFLPQRVQPSEKAKA